MAAAAAAEPQRRRCQHAPASWAPGPRCGRRRGASTACQRAQVCGGRAQPRRPRRRPLPPPRRCWRATPASPIRARAGPWLRRRRTGPRPASCRCPGCRPAPAAAGPPRGPALRARQRYSRPRAGRPCRPMQRAVRRRGRQPRLRSRRPGRQAGRCLGRGARWPRCRRRRCWRRARRPPPPARPTAPPAALGSAATRLIIPSTLGESKCGGMVHKVRLARRSL